MNFRQALEKLEESKVFKDWKKDNPGAYLAHGFFMASEDVQPEWQIGYYDKKKNKISAFCVSSDVTCNPESEPFTDKDTVAELDMSKLKISYEQAREKAESIQKSKYRAHTPMKKIFIVQNLAVGQVWNITYVTQTFNTLNIKIGTEDGEVLSDELVSIFKVE